jgi:MFS family permease
LGLALGDRTRAKRLALLGILGFSLGGIVVLVISLNFSDSENYATRGVTGIFGGPMVGASLALAFGDWERIIALTLAGAVGFGVGVVIGAFALQEMFGESFLVGTSGTIILYAITGIIGGASLGAALGYLENRTLAERQSVR